MKPTRIQLRNLEKRLYQRLRDVRGNRSAASQLRQEERAIRDRDIETIRSLREPCLVVDGISVFRTWYMRDLIKQICAVRMAQFIPKQETKKPPSGG